LSRIVGAERSVEATVEDCEVFTGSEGKVKRQQILRDAERLLHDGDTAAALRTLRDLEVQLRQHRMMVKSGAVGAAVPGRIRGQLAEELEEAHQEVKERLDRVEALRLNERRDASQARGAEALVCEGRAPTTSAKMSLPEKATPGLGVVPANLRMMPTEQAHNKALDEHRTPEEQKARDAMRAAESAAAAVEARWAKASTLYEELRDWSAIPGRRRRVTGHPATPRNRETPRARNDGRPLGELRLPGVADRSPNWQTSPGAFPIWCGSSTLVTKLALTGKTIICNYFASR